MTIASSAGERWMAPAIAQARVAECEGDLSIGALIVYGAGWLALEESTCSANGNRNGIARPDTAKHGHTRQ